MLDVEFFSLLVSYLTITRIITYTYDNKYFLELYEGDKTADTALVLLQAAAAQSENISDEIATKFQEKEILIDEYLEQFMAARKNMHARKLKAEKMLEIIQMDAENKSGLTSKNPKTSNNYFNLGATTGYIPFSQHKHQTFRNF